MSVITSYIADRLNWGWGETTLSSDAMLRQALGGHPVEAWERPSSWDELVFCHPTYQHAPWVLRRRMRPIMDSFRAQLREREKPGVRLVDDELMYSAEWLNDNTEKSWPQVGPAWSGKSDGTLGPIRHETIHQAVAWIDEQEKIDPEGVARGDYYIDSQEPE